MINITGGNVGRIAERIVANELEARGFRVSDLNKEGVSANADLLAVKPGQTLQIQVKGAANKPKGPLWIQYGHFNEDIIQRNRPIFNHVDSFYKATVVICVAVRSPREYTCVVMPIDMAEKAAGLHRESFKAAGWQHAPTHMTLEAGLRAKESEQIKQERRLLALYRDELGWARLLESKLAQ
jgi:Holliday junction resolvase